MPFFKKKNKQTAVLEDSSKSMSPAAIAAKAKELKLKGRRLSQQLFNGDTRSAFQGRGMSFKEVRQYQAGDDVRFIDWNVSARMGHTYSKVFEEERELSFFLLVDMSASNLFGTFGQTKQEQIAQMSALIAFSAVGNNDKIGALFFTDKVEKYIPAKKNQEHAMFLVKQLLGFSPTSNGTNIDKALKYLNGIVKQQSIVFVISDFSDDSYKDALKIAARRHEIVGIQIYDPGEKQLPRVGLLAVKDAETGRDVWLNTNDDIARRMYLEQFNSKLENTQNFFRECGASLIQIGTNEDYLKVLKNFFKRR